MSVSETSASKRRIGVYPGTFDPITNGHLDIIQRASRQVDHLIVGVARNAGKGPLYSTDERVAMVREDVAALNTNGTSIEVRAFDTLLMHFAVEMNAGVIIRGLRAVSDFEYEFQMAGMNARLNPKVETIFLMSSEKHQFISSRFVKEIGRLGGDIRHFVSPRVAERLAERFAQEARGPSDSTSVQTLS
ncbi:pantetheine-phosphate adenylyltransferase [Azospirillum doebereinerae]|uniref:Phosphopantetheine adenylyltransferase n=1 Tax=Azospirillum doebereinerae TaxID=92933 RepID=A0A3S0WQJ6_9PROT|nr:pantetheine-phosphate adenylyltransferase [Azospirillum doebereinerae]MCG5240869.1 pantetheine-phosphate adenylyltransferase [Azospirillum doebereinerae]RUQ61975.1 pantetheine-phosphate adenylyltransferase [Azospirillum doebereinerae]